MKTQNTQAAIIDIRFAVMVLRRVFKRSGVWSIQRPSNAEKQIEAKVVTIPLTCLRTRHRLKNRKKPSWNESYRIELATRVSGYAAAVKII